MPVAFIFSKNLWFLEFPLHSPFLFNVLIHSQLLINIIIILFYPLMTIIIIILIVIIFIQEESIITSCFKEGSWRTGRCLNMFFLFFMWWLAVECYDPLGIDSRMKTIKDNRITASSMKDDQHKPSFARLRGNNAWCSSRKDMSPYLQISLAEAYQISGIETQGSESDCMWVKLYEIHYTTNVTAGWKVHKVLNIF